MTVQSSEQDDRSGLLLDGAMTDELVRRWREADQSDWRPDWDAVGPQAARASPRSVLPHLLLALGLLAVVAFVAGTRAAIEVRGDLDPLQWLRLVMLAVASILVIGQGWVLFARTATGQAVTERLVRAGERWRQPQPWRPPPQLDAVSLAELRRASGDQLRDPEQWERFRRRARRSTAGAIWWVLVALSLVLSTGIVALMAILIGREMGDGRSPGGWIVLPASALGVAVLGFGYTVRTARRSVRDRRQRRRGRLFRRTIGWVSRGSPATGTAGGTGAGAPVGAAGGASAAVPGMTARLTRPASPSRPAGGTGSPALGGGVLVSGLAGAEPDVGADPAGASAHDVVADPAGGGAMTGSNKPHGDHLVPYLGAVISAFFLGFIPWGGVAVIDAVAEDAPPVPVASSTPAVTATPQLTPIVPLGGGGDFISPDASPAPTPDGFMQPLGSGEQPASPTDDLADPAQPPAAPPETPAPAIAPPTPTPAPTPALTPRSTPTPAATPSPTPVVTPTPTPPPVPSPEPDPPDDEPPPDDDDEPLPREPDPRPRDPDPPRDPIPQ